MKVIFMPQISFGTRKICDSHVHTGNWEGGRCYAKQDLDCFIKNDRDKMVVSNLDCICQNDILDELSGNEKLLNELSYDAHYVPLAVCQPNITKGGTSAVEELLDKHSEFKGLKFHPRAMNLPVGDNIELYAPYMELANRRLLPCLFHSEGSETSNVEDIYKLAKLYPDVPVILGHMAAGGKIQHDKAIKVFEDSLKKNDANLYVDLSWVDWQNGLPSKEKPSVVNVINTALNYGAEDRILFGTDAPLGCFGECLEGGLSANEAYNQSVETLENTIDRYFPNKAEDLKDKIFYDNAAKLYGF